MIRSTTAREAIVRGTVRLARGDGLGALAEMDQALEAEPDCAEAYNNRGVAHHALRDMERAIADFDRALEIAPGYAEAYNNRGSANRARRDVARAASDFDCAIDANPRYADAYNNRGLLRLESGDAEGALADLDRALKLRPSYSEAYENRAAAQTALGNHVAAIADYGHALLSKPNSASSLAGRATARCAIKDYSGAIVDFDTLLGLIPRQDAAKIYHARGGAHHAQMKVFAALADYERAIEIDPGFCVAYVSRGNARFHLCDLTAIEDFGIAYRINPELTVAEMIRGLIIERDRGLELILENSRKHIQNNPRDLIAHGRRGLVLTLVGRDDEAEHDYEQILNGNPQYEKALLELIAEAKRQREF